MDLGSHFQIWGRMMAGGIYRIRNEINGKSYIGSSVNVQERWKQHLRAVRHGDHHNTHLQRAFDKYGEEAFDFSVLEHVEDASQLIPREQHHLDTLNPEYNICPTAGSQPGYHPSPETCTKLSVALMGHPVSPEAREKISRARKGKPLSPEHRLKISEAAKARRLSEETKQKIRRANIGERNPNYGKRRSPETCLKISESLKAYWREAE